MTTVGTITELWRYPVKSMGGERMSGVGLDKRGVHADRVGAVRDVGLGVSAHADRCLGIYADVERGGRLAEGDALTFEPPAAPGVLGTSAGTAARRTQARPRPRRERGAARPVGAGP